jgi:excisionase family DNA binding protein
VDEIAAVLRCDSLVIYNEIHRGALKAYQVGRIFRVLDKDFHDYLDAQIVRASVEIAAKRKYKRKPIAKK